MIPIWQEPVFFVVSNRMPPRPFNVKSHVTPEMLVSFATNVTAVKVVRIADAEDFRENCLRRKQCAAVIYDGNYTEGEAEVVKNAARLHRAVAVVEVDTRKLRLSIEESLPPNKVCSPVPPPHTRERERERERKTNRLTRCALLCRPPHTRL